MKQIKFVESKYKFFARLLIMSASFILLNGALLSNNLLEVPEASAESQYGILGQMVPELELADWIDGRGEKIEPIKLHNYRGKVVYLYFFQDW